MSIFLMGSGEWGLGNGDSGIGKLTADKLVADSREWGLGKRFFMDRPISDFIGFLWIGISLIVSNLRHPVSAGGAMRSKGGHILPGIR